ncbi:MAG: DNA-binding protein YbiB [Burkholderiales bacterium]
MTYSTLIKALACRPDPHELAPEDAALAFGAMLDGGVPELELGAMLVALRMKGESPGELLGAYEALAARVHQLQSPLADASRTVVIGTGEGTRSRPNLTPLVALVLRRMGVPVLVHGALEGHGRVAAAYVFRELGVLPCATLAQAQAALDRDQLAFVPTAVFAPGLVALQALRSRLGVPNTAHLLARLVDPLPGASLRLIGLSEPADLARMRDVILATGERALILAGTDDEPFADPRHRPQLELVDDGASVVLFGEEHAPVDAAATLPEGRGAKATAGHIRRLLEGAAPLPLPIVNEVACCLYGAGVTDDLNHAKAIVAVEAHAKAGRPLAA